VFIRLRQGQMARFCEHGNEPLGLLIITLINIKQFTISKELVPHVGKV
jgi:hypothetical protein